MDVPFLVYHIEGEKLHLVVLHEVKEALYSRHLIERKIASSIFIHNDAA